MQTSQLFVSSDTNLAGLDGLFAGAKPPKKKLPKAAKPAKVKLTRDTSRGPATRRTPGNGGGILALSRTAYDPAPVMQSSQPKGASWLDKVLTVASQSISAFGPNNSIQSVGGQAPIYGGGYNPQQYQGMATDYLRNDPSYGQGYPGDASQGVGRGLGQGLGSGLDGIINWATENPLIVGAGALGLFLLFKQPPGRK